MVYVLLVIVIFCIAVFLLFTLRLNKKQIDRLLYYQYNYIPESLIGGVKVVRLKEDDY